MTKKLFNNITRYSHKILEEFEIDGILNLSRKTLCKLIVAFAHCKKLSIKNISSINLAGKHTVTEKCKIHIQELWLESKTDGFNLWKDELY